MKSKILKICYIITISVLLPILILVFTYQFIKLRKRYGYYFEVSYLQYVAETLRDIYSFELNDFLKNK